MKKDKKEKKSEDKGKDQEIKASIVKMKQEIRSIPSLDRSDEDLGMGELLKIMPDTWNNISWVLQNSAETLVSQAKKQRRM